MSGHRKKWKPWEEELLASRLGEPWDEIGTDLERSAKACLEKAYRLGLVGPGTAHG